MSRECESAWCISVPSLPWDDLLGAGWAAIGAFGGIMNGFKKPQLPTSPTPTTNDDEYSDERAWPDPDMKSGLLPGEEQDQCQNNLPGLQQSGEVSFFTILLFSVPLIRRIKESNILIPQKK